MVLLAYAAMGCGFRIYRLACHSIYYFQYSCDHVHYCADEHFLERSNNLIYSVLLHFGFNIIYVFLDANIGFFVILTILYLLITPLAVLIRNRTVRTF